MLTFLLDEHIIKWLLPDKTSRLYFICFAKINCYFKNSLDNSYLRIEKIIREAENQEEYVLKWEKFKESETLTTNNVRYIYIINKSNVDVFLFTIWDSHGYPINVLKEGFSIIRSGQEIGIIMEEYNAPTRVDLSVGQSIFNILYLKKVARLRVLSQEKKLKFSKRPGTNKCSGICF